ncbi:hypothetical protein DWX10_17105 [Clostridium sp. AF18-27]|jgi:hypothetical protein|uniref:hypothetical protein n=1 Tax=Enterocloster TaxID=2719313 RepID=UPI000AED6D1F|nr:MULTISPECIES: hypothetical protein [Enterocloster]MBS5603710.1 hypothetical protein [Enterocloster asparagiformis]MDR3758839.1 hypothetical protein [Enterocloster sp.]PST31822.1 hypothetical protein C7256_18425 [Enterocloster lavalensis]RHR51304.1 hypothetical protein DWX10_17105 [Clostridium sp. AF18-27]
MLEEKDLQVLKSMMETVVNARASKTETLLLQMIQDLKRNVEELHLPDGQYQAATIPLILKRISPR